MHWSATLVVCLVAGCTLADPPPPPVAPPSEDLSTWTVPDLLPDPAPPAVPPVPPPAPAPTLAEKVYLYRPGNTYAVSVMVGMPLDIVFARGEQVRNVTDGDRGALPEGETRRWGVSQGLEGLGAALRYHVFVSVTQPGLKNGLIVTTTLRTLYITLESVTTSPTRVLRWTEESAPRDAAPPLPAGALGPLPPLQHHYHVGYAVESQGRRPDWQPVGVWDDGKKTYILLPRTTVYGTTPLVRKLGPNGPAVVNGRQYLNVLIVDELAAQLELRVGVGDAADVVRLTRGSLQTIACPADPACPVWPMPEVSYAR